MWPKATNVLEFYYHWRRGAVVGGGGGDKGAGAACAPHFFIWGGGGNGMFNPTCLCAPPTHTHTHFLAPSYAAGMCVHARANLYYYLILLIIQFYYYSFLLRSVALIHYYLFTL